MQVVFLELCVERRSTLTMTKEEVRDCSKSFWFPWTRSDSLATYSLHTALWQVLAPGELFKLWRAGKVPLLFVAYSWMLSQVADALGVLPGEEFRAALLEAQQVSGPYCLASVPVVCTFFPIQLGC